MLFPPNIVFKIVIICIWQTKATISILRCVSLAHVRRVPLFIYLKLELLGCSRWESSVLQIPNYPPKCWYQFIPPPAIYNSSWFTSNSISLGIIKNFYFCLWESNKMILYYLTCSSLIPKKIDNLFVYLLPRWASSLVNCLFIYFMQFLLGNFSSTDYSSFVGYRIENIFSQSMVWFLALFIVFLVVKFVCFM